MGGLYALKKALLLSLIIHVLAGAVMALGGHSWFASRDLDERGRVDIDVLRIAEESGRGEKAKAEVAPQTKSALKPQSAANAMPRASDETLSQTSTTDANSAAANVSNATSTEGDRVTIDGDGRSQQLTVGEYMKWVMAHNELPKYPRLARLRGEQGRAAVRVVVAARGMPPESIEIEQTSGSELLDRVALEAVQGWTFPAFSGRARVTIVIPFRFSLDES